MTCNIVIVKTLKILRNLVLSIHIQKLKKIFNLFGVLCLNIFYRCIGVIL